MATIISTPPIRDIYYPESDGKPIAETDIHRKELLETIQTLDAFFRDRPDVYVSGNLLLYYEEGNRHASTAPDVFVVFGVAKHDRRTYKLWEEQQPPTVVIEFTSRKTRDEDLGEKRLRYAALGVREYFLSDPLAEYLVPPLQGYQLVDEEYFPLPADAAGGLISSVLGLRLVREGHRLRLIDLATGERLPRPDEVDAARQAAEEQALVAEEQTRVEAAARRAAEEQARAAAEHARAAEEQARAAAEHARAAEEQARVEAIARQAAEAELEQLRAELARLRGAASSS